MKATRTLSSYVLLVGVMGLSIVGGIVAYQIYSASIKSQTTAQQTTAIKPLDGVINQTTINNLEQRTKYSESEMDSLLSTASIMTTESAGATAEAVPVIPRASEATGSTEIQP